MQLAIIVYLFTTAVVAVPATIFARDICSSGVPNSVARCCTVDTAGVADLECEDASTDPNREQDLGRICG
ncbi:hypothetical protein VHEMI05944 [[Torrubiella] hemipterigena]|uniref:Hydrophobin n=1 Tax=[Torrubiella] hemipterigena TaxID=1531966 RepID=A0A0A1THX8_9HYPO|nr:hypothetical protein VHEMI05944 [[Torrubiella] hemipterigena]